ncbi:MAG: hypothetical protein ACKN9T_01230 [Candidatus Methylumidiphilus sp.]
MMRTASLNVVDVIFVAAKQTADFQMTKGLRDILANDGNTDDLIDFISEKNLPIDDIELHSLASEILATPPEQGYLTISNALQWRLQYSRIIEKAGTVLGVDKVYSENKV